MRKMRSQFMLLVLLGALAVTFLPFLRQDASGFTAPPNFRDEAVIDTGVLFPTAFEFLPDGRMLIAEFTGKLQLAQRGAITPDSTPVLQLTNMFQEDVTVGGERGLVNVVADPAFSTNGFFYLFYTAATPKRDRVSRFTMTGGTASLASELVVWQGRADSTSSDHHGGGLAFGPDGKLYISTGDNGDPASSQLLSGDHGKILRVNKDGTIPPDDPFIDGAGPNVDAIWALGLRNPYRFSFDSVTGRLLIGEVGGNTGTSIEEVNIGVRGANYGWPVCEGPCQTAGMTDPLFSYSHGGRDSAITGGFVYHGSQFPASYDGAYFYGDFAKNWLKYLTFDANGDVNGGGNFVPANGSADSAFDPVMLKQGPDGCLYYSDFGWGWLGSANPAAIRRVCYTSGNQPPLVVASATPQNGLLPLLVSFSSTGSSDPENDPLSYTWSFGDGSTSNQPNPTHVYSANGVYIGRLALSDGTSTTLSPVLMISVGNPPTGTITSPPNGLPFKAGDLISFAGIASDPEDGPLGPSAFSWTVLFHHDTHIHPGLGPISGVASGSFTIPNSGHDFTGNTNYEIILTVTDSNGLQQTSSVFVYPQKVRLTFSTNPTGLVINVDGIPHTTPYVADDLIGFQHTVDAPTQSQGSSTYVFSSWSDGGSQSHTVVVPSANQSYTANFTVSQPPPGLVAAYGFNEGVGPTAGDQSGGGNVGTISGAAWTGAGKFGGALSFNGVNNWVTVADANSLDLTSGMTLEAWVFPTALGSGVWRNVLIKERAMGEVYNLYANADTNAPVVYVVRAAQTGTPLDARGTSTLPLNTWTHLATTYDGTTLRLFVNGTQVGTRAAAGPLLTSTGVLRIGGNSLWGEYFQGQIDEVRIYNRALTQPEIQTDMNRAVGTSTPDTTPPGRSNGQPTGTLAAGTTQATLSLTTDEAATCRVAPAPGIAYGSMPNTFTTTGGTSHSTLVTGLIDGGSYSYYVRCQDTALPPNANVTDYAISFSVATPAPDTTPPVRSNGQPTGLLAAGTTQTTLGLTTDENATCRYAAVAGVSYGSMPNIFTTSGGTSHSTTVTGLTNGGSYSYYVRCRDTAAPPNANGNDFAISFSVATPPPDTTPPVRSNGQPTGTLPVGTTQATLSLMTDEAATCRYATVAGIAYGSMPNTFTTTGGTSHSTLVTGLANGGSYSRYVRCQDKAAPPNANGNDFAINFSVATPPPPSLVAVYGFNEASGGTVTDASGNGNTGTISGASRTGAGKFGGGLSFNGVNNWVTVADANSLDLTSGMTLEAWVFPTALGSGVWRNVLIKERAMGEVYNLYANADTNAPVVYVVRAAQTGTPLDARGTITLSLNTWTHLATTFDGTTLRLFVNGTQVGTRAVAGPLLTSTGALRIGGNSLWGEYFQGQIDEVRIYNRGLTQPEIQTDMNTPVTP